MRSPSLLTCAGASVGVSISTQRRMPSRMSAASKGFLGVAAIGRRLLCEVRPMSCACVRGRVNPDDSGGFRRFRRVFSGFALGDLLDQVDDAAPEFGVGNAREGACQRKSLGSREKIGDIGGRGALG